MNCRGKVNAYSVATVIIKELMHSVVYIKHVNVRR